MLGAACLVALVCAYFRNLQIAQLLPLSTSSFVATYVLSMAAAVRLLRGREAALAAISLAGCLVVLAFVGPLSLWLIAVSLAAVSYGVVARRLRAREIPAS